MNDAVFVRGLERRGDLLRNREGIVARNRSLSNPIRQRRSFDQFENQRGYEPAEAGPDDIGLFETVDGRDVRVIERSKDLRFALALKGGRR
jgi:hypothetical protein